jgi:Rrf2 family iron-sulfur cluster assembly transcriptional regulator
MILGTKARYAVMAMVDLAGRNSDEPVRLVDLASSQEITVPYLEQLFAKLRDHGLVQSVRGPGGGYMLCKPANQIFILEVIKAVEENVKMTRCDKQEHSGCMSKKARCLTHDLWQGLEQNIHDYLDGISLADVRSQKSPKDKM